MNNRNSISPYFNKVLKVLNFSGAKSVLTKNLYNEKLTYQQKGENNENNKNIGKN